MMMWRGSKFLAKHHECVTSRARMSMVQNDNNFLSLPLTFTISNSIKVFVHAFLQLLLLIFLVVIAPSLVCQSFMYIFNLYY